MTVWCNARLVLRLALLTISSKSSLAVAVGVKRNRMKAVEFLHFFLPPSTSPSPQLHLLLNFNLRLHLFSICGSGPSTLLHRGGPLLPLVSAGSVSALGPKHYQSKKETEKKNPEERLSLYTPRSESSSRLRLSVLSSCPPYLSLSCPSIKKKRLPP